MPIQRCQRCPPDPHTPTRGCIRGNTSYGGGGGGDGDGDGDGGGGGGGGSG